jgi:hypothetical protein
MDQYTKNRFKEYDNLSLEELLIRRDFLSKEAIEEEQIINDKNTSSYQSSEACSDLKFSRDCLLYIEILLSERKIQNAGGRTK